MSKQNDSKNESSKQNEPTFSIQPHPAQTNNPSDLMGGPKDVPSVGERLSQLASSGPGPHTLSNAQQSSISEPLTREELRRRAAELNE